MSYNDDMDKQLIELGDEIRAARKADPRSLSQRALAEAVGVHRETIIEIEHGKRNPTYALVMKLREYLGMEDDEK